MPTTSKRSTRARPFSFWRRLKEISMFFQGKDEVHKSLRRLVRRLERAGIVYAVAGGMAVNAHKYRRTTADVDLLLTLEGFEEFKKRFVKKNYLQTEGRARRFTDRQNEVEIDFLLAGMYPGSGKPGPVVFPDPEEVAEVIHEVQVINLATLVQLKLAAGRHRDFGDVVELIRFNDLDESFARQLDKSVRDDYIECLDEKRREDEYEARNG